MILRGALASPACIYERQLALIWKAEPEAYDNTKHVRPCNRKRRTEHARKQPLKPSQVARRNIFGHWAWIPPISESKGVSMRVHPNHEEECHDQKADDEYNLHQRDPKLCLAEKLG